MVLQRLLPIIGAVIVAWCGAGPTGARAATSAARPMSPAGVSFAAMVPRIVLQTKRPPDVAAWTARDDFVLLVSGNFREVEIWEVARGVLVDTVRLPMPSPVPGAEADLPIIDGIELADDGRTAIVIERRYTTSKDAVVRTISWEIDLTTRRATQRAMRPGDTQPAALKEGEESPINIRDAAMRRVNSGEDTGITVDQANSVLPRLPRSHDGRWSIERGFDGIVLQGDTTKRFADTVPPVRTRSAAMSPNGRILAILTDRCGSGPTGETQVILLDPSTGQRQPSLKRPGNYGRVQWLDERRLALFADDEDDGRDPADETSSIIPSPTLVIDTDTRQDVLKLEPRCYVTVAGTGFAGAGLGNCRTVDGDRRLWFADESGNWSFSTDLDQGTAVELMVASADGKRVAMVASLDDGALKIVVVDRVGAGATQQIVGTGRGNIEAMAFFDSGKSLLFIANGQLFRREISSGPVNDAPKTLQVYGTTGVLTRLLLTDGVMIMTSGFAATELTRFDIASGKRLIPFAHSNAVSGGFMDGGLFWAIGGSGELRLWDLQSGKVLVSNFLFSEGFFAQDPQGRYDTNLGADARTLRWLMPDEPWRSLAPQIFMRELYEPGLMRKIMACAAKRCTPALGTVPDLASLNRTLPAVEIVAVEPGPHLTARVTVEARETVNREAANGKTQSGVYDLRLFRDGKLVRQTPSLGAARDEGKTLQTWRARTAMPLAMKHEVYRETFEVALPRRGGKVEFTAYAFNEDRVKGETARRSIDVPPPPVPPRRRLVVVAIGVDATRNPEWRLNYAANDARALGAALRAAPGAEVTVIPLISDAGADRATKRTIRSVLLALGGEASEDNRYELAEAGIDLAKLASVGPDDTVVIAFSGHGTTLGREFYLLPSDTVDDAAGAPLPDSMISSVELTAWLRQLDAGEIAFVIDACHSAASVDAGGFKPGPMGDPGLGQLAFDKGIRILAATQANDVALEDGKLGHGLLSFALNEGLGGRADANRDGAVTLGEWLNYGVERMPGLAAELRNGAVKLSRAVAAPPPAGAAVWFDAPDASVTRVQQPTLFDFTGTPGALVLRRDTAAPPPRVTSRDISLR